MNARVFCVEDGDEDAWYWVETDEKGESLDEAQGPFAAAIQAAAAARKAIVEAAKRQEIVFTTKKLTK
jgi:hypothetical protein